MTKDLRAADRAGGRRLTGAALVVVAALLAAGCGSVPAPVTGSAANSSPTSPPPAASLGTGGPLPPASLDVSPAPDIPAALGPGAAVATWPVPTAGPPATIATFRVPILMYHRIIAAADSGGSLPGLCVPPAVFDAQLTALADAGWHTITMATLAADLASGTRPPPRTFVLTFDDGYRDGLTNALPILLRHGFVGTFYVVTGRMADPRNLHPADLVTLAKAGMEIGDHTVNHVDLARLSPAQVAYQIDDAAATVASIVGRRPVTFAYPFGAFNSTVIAAVASAGLAVAVRNVARGPVDWTNRFLLPRMEVGPWTRPAALLARVASSPF